MRSRWLIGLSMALLLVLLVAPIAQAAPATAPSEQSCGYWYTVQPGDCMVPSVGAYRRLDCGLAGRQPGSHPSPQLVVRGPHAVDPLRCAASTASAAERRLLVHRANR